jgi:hypothetical protein
MKFITEGNFSRRTFCNQIGRWSLVTVLAEYSENLLSDMTCSLAAY